MRAPWLTFLLVATALAGCSDSGGDGGNDADPLADQALSDIDLEATATTGVIRGVIVDPAIRPIAGVEVTVLVANQEPRVSVTTETGAFGFSDLPPATYFVKASKQGYFDAQSSVEVVAGVDTPEAVKLFMEINAEAIAYIQEYVFDGFIECSTTYIALCGAANGGGVNVTNDHFIQYWDLDAAPEWVQSEMIWQTTQALSDRMWLWHSYGSPEHSFEGSLPDPWVAGPSPLVVTHNATQAAEVSLGSPNSLAIRIFSGDIEGTTPPVCVVYCLGPGFAIQQDFKVFSHIFHNYLPPVDWRFSEDAPPLPP